MACSIPCLCAAIRLRPSTVQVEAQVLQLLDLRTPQERDWRDPENVLLNDNMEMLTLRELGITPGAVLQLHSLGPPKLVAQTEESASASGDATKAPLAILLGASASDMEVR